MEYSSGQPIKIGDLVEISDGSPGVVVAIINERLGRADFLIEDWLYLKDGIIVDTKKAGIIHYPESFLYHIGFVSHSEDDEIKK